ncbi:MAG: DUF4102 domain-containing protein, partial [Acetobacteraceae bacterium]|nr:DUF4102 domain-containing protein [Acetobacteraceae bacterium]
MGAVKLTDRTVAGLACPSGRKDVLFFDTELKGFGLRVTAAGTRIFLCQYRVGSKVRRKPVGEWPTVTT